MWPVYTGNPIYIDIEILLQSMLPVGSVKEADVPPPAPRPESPAGCFSCNDLTHETEQCPVLDESFPYLPLGWRADRIDDEFILQPGPRGPLPAGGKRRLIRVTRMTLNPSSLLLGRTFLGRQPEPKWGLSGL